MRPRLCRLPGITWRPQQIKFAGRGRQTCVQWESNLRAVGVGRFPANFRFLSPSRRRIPMEFRAAEGSIGRFRKNFSFLFPFLPFCPPRSSQEKGTKFEKWPGNAHSAMPRSRKAVPKSRNRGTKIEKSSINARSRLSRLPATNWRPQFIIFAGCGRGSAGFPG